MISHYLPFIFVVSRPIPEALEAGFRLQLKLDGLIPNAVEIL